MAVVVSCVHVLLLCLEWLHAHTIGPLVDVLDEGVLGSWEEVGTHYECGLIAQLLERGRYHASLPRV